MYYKLTQLNNGNKMTERESLFIPAKKGNGLLFIIIFAIIFSCIFLIPTGKLSYYINGKIELRHFSSIEECSSGVSKTESHLCDRQYKYAMALTEVMEWPYESIVECEWDFGNMSCMMGDDEKWRPRGYGFALIKDDEKTHVIPTFYSFVHSKTYLSTGFPINPGLNKIPFLKKDEIGNLYKGIKLDEELCLVFDDVEACNPRSKWSKHLDSMVRDKLIKP